MQVNLAQLAGDYLDLSLTDEQVERFETYMGDLLDWNQRMNLTSITDPDAVRIKHFLDSLSLLTLPGLPDFAEVIDVGAGAGLPGIALAIAKDHWDVTLLEATGKKVEFANVALENLRSPNARAVKLRAEEAGQDPDYRAGFDIVVARAVARMPVLAEYMLPLCRVYGICVAMKGITAQEEADDAAFAIKTLGGAVETIHTVNLPTVDDPHYLVVIRKINETPKQYPRRDGLPKKEPLMKKL